MRDELDRFYTKHTVAKACIDKVLEITENFGIIVEPSAGGGAFSDQIDNCMSFDLSPTKEGIIQKDWLTTVQEDFPKDYENMLVIGNPPFGSRSALAKNFIRHSIVNLKASTIAFILPKTFNKRTSQSVFPPNWRLILISELDNSSSTFELQKDEDIFIPCDFFVWTNRSDLMASVDLRKQKATVPEEIVFLQRGSKEADITINGNNGKVKLPEEVTNSKAEHYIKINPTYDKDSVIEFLKNLKYSFHSSVNGGVAWINKDDISETFSKSKVADFKMNTSHTNGSIL